MERIYMCIDLKSFYASVECHLLGLDPLTTNLVVADESRTEKTVCLAVSPSLKKYGIRGRARLYEVKQIVRKINYERKMKTRNYKFTSKSYFSNELDKNNNLELDFIIAKPRMSYYIKYSTDIYNIYLKYIAPEDIYVYSIDEVFIDATNYMNMYKMTPFELVTKIIKDVYDNTGITATAGIGTNMYLCKVAMDIVAKHKDANEFGVRVAYLDEMKYRYELWNHTPLTDFWRFGKGTQDKLSKYGIKTMGDIARTSLNNEDLLYKLFGVNAELLIDHAWGYESVTMSDIKAYKPSTNTLSSGQVLHEAYTSSQARLIVKEMMDLLSLELVEKNYVTGGLVLTIGYDVENINKGYKGNIVTDYYGRSIPKPAHGTLNLEYKTSSTKILIKNIINLYDKIVNPNLLIRRINIVAIKLENIDTIQNQKIIKQFSLFDNSKEISSQKNKERENLKDELKVQKTILKLKNKYGKNAIIKGMDLEKYATTIKRNKQIGGHNE